jgi:hypothetical protein
LGALRAPKYTPKKVRIEGDSDSVLVRLSTVDATVGWRRGFRCVQASLLAYFDECMSMRGAAHGPEDPAFTIHVFARAP